MVQTEVDSVGEPQVLLPSPLSVQTIAGEQSTAKERALPPAPAASSSTTLGTSSAPAPQDAGKDKRESGVAAAAPSRDTSTGADRLQDLREALVAPRSAPQPAAQTRLSERKSNAAKPPTTRSLSRRSASEPEKFTGAVRRAEAARHALASARANARVAAEAELRREEAGRILKERDTLTKQRAESERSMRSRAAQRARRESEKIKQARTRLTDNTTATGRADAAAPRAATSGTNKTDAARQVAPFVTAPPVQPDAETIAAPVDTGQRFTPASSNRAQPAAQAGASSTPETLKSELEESRSSTPPPAPSTLERSTSGLASGLEVIRDLIANDQLDAARRALDQLLTRYPEMQVPLDISAALEFAR